MIIILYLWQIYLCAADVAFSWKQSKLPPQKSCPVSSRKIIGHLKTKPNKKRSRLPKKISSIPKHPKPCTLPETNEFLHLKIDINRWLEYDRFLLGPLFSGAFAVSFRECNGFSRFFFRPGGGGCLWCLWRPLLEPTL